VELTARVQAGEEALAEARGDAERRLDAERATTTEVHSRLATAREEATRTIAAEAEETERLRAELETARAEAERLLAAERAEVARLREELIARDGEPEAEESSRRMLERISRELDRERTTTRNLRRELDSAHARSAERRRADAEATANGTATFEEPLDRAVRTPEGTQRRVSAARANASRRVPQVSPSPYGLWAVRIGAALLIALLGVALVVLLSAVH
jgi:chromosome segregation ATPase